MKKKILPALLCALCLLCGVLSSCQSTGKDKPDLSPVLPAVCRTELVRISARFSQLFSQFNRTVSMPLGEWENHRLCLKLEEHRIKWWKWDDFQVDRILVYLDGEITQTILPPETMPEQTWDEWSGPCDGLFSFDPYFKHGQPIVMDLNFDGYLDFGLMCSRTFARNIPYFFYLWNPEQARFDCLGALNYTIEVDRDAQQLLETIYSGGEVDTLNRYGWKDGKLVLLQKKNISHYTGR